MISYKELVDGYKEYMGMTIKFDGDILAGGFKVAIMVISGIILIGTSAVIQKRRNVMIR